ncbi:ALKBH3 [Symbiodinium natans]|uniref:ALKBH3 protein n=1 Tax=Symbiodinium natans TaxID=878477 RepID=A0A812U0P5_9DINO|nr:ALKBH3 [Symbiodinium natans]
MLIGVIGVVCIAVAALGRKVKKEREMVFRLHPSFQSSRCKQSVQPREKLDDGKRKHKEHEVKAVAVSIVQALASGSTRARVVDLEEAREESHTKRHHADKQEHQELPRQDDRCKPPLAAAAWPIRRLPAQPATVRTAQAERAVPDEELAALAPVHVIRHALPRELADQLLVELLRESLDAWAASSWVVHGKEFTTPRTSAIYEFRELKGLGSTERATASSFPKSNVCSSTDVADGHGREESRARCEPSAALHRAATIMQTLVRERRPQTNWEPTLALGNRYENGRACVGWHSDFLNSLGPRPIIVGLSLGSCRRFCLRRTARDDESSPTHAEAMVASIPMPHNTAVIMWDDCQEEWQHSVPRQADSTIGKHPLAGHVRLSLTFRMSRPELARHQKSCHCGRPSALKSKAGRYYLACSPMGASKQCSFWEPCSWAQEEAERLRQRMKLEVLHALPLQGPAQAGCISPLGGPSPCPPHTTHKLYAGQENQTSTMSTGRPASAAGTDAISAMFFEVSDDDG